MVKRTNGAIAALLAFVVACLIMAPAAACAEERAVEVENHTVAQDWKATVSDIHIGGVDTPAAGTQLDDKAQVTTAENEEWDIPVLRVRDDLVIMPDAAKADEVRTYLPIGVHATDEPSATGDAEDGTAETAQPTLVDIYCAQTAATRLPTKTSHGLSTS